MFLVKKSQLDERQLLLRGNIFKHGLFILTALILCNSMLAMVIGIEWAPDRWSELTIILFTITVCSIEFLWYDIYPLTENRQKYFIYLLGIYGAVSIFICLYEMFQLNLAAFINGKLSLNLLGILYGGMFLSIFITYICKKIADKRIGTEE